MLTESDRQSHAKQTWSFDTNRHIHEVLFMKQPHSELDVLSSDRRIYLGAIIFFHQS